MEWNVLFFVNSVLLGVGLTMDAFSVSLANGLNEPKMRKKKMCGVAGVYAFFQALMPMTGWICVHTIVQYFRAFEKFIPWIALILLLYIGGKMLWDGFRNDEEEEKPGVGAWALFVQGVATSIDALSVGFTIAEYDFYGACLFPGHCYRNVLFVFQDLRSVNGSEQDLPEKQRSLGELF